MKKNIFTLLLFIATSLLATSTFWPKINNADVSFAQNMSEHHNQAIEMSFVLLAGSENDELKGLAYDIINTQATQRGMMMGWLQSWNEPMSSNINHAQMESMGMASDNEIKRLYSLSGNELDSLFIELMTNHHLGGIKMAETYVQNGKYTLQMSLAETMIAGKQGKIDYLKSLNFADEAI